MILFPPFQVNFRSFAKTTLKDFFLFGNMKTWTSPHLSNLNYTQIKDLSVYANIPLMIILFLFNNKSDYYLDTRLWAFQLNDYCQATSVRGQVLDHRKHLSNGWRLGLILFYAQVTLPELSSWRMSFGGRIRQVLGYMQHLLPNEIQIHRKQDLNEEYVSSPCRCTWGKSRKTGDYI